MVQDRAVRPLPPALDCAEILPGYTFADCYGAAVPAGADAVAVTRAAFQSPPAWITFLLRLRNRIVGLIGLKGAELGGFPLISERPDFVCMGFDDWHLDFRLVATVAGGTASLTTIVRTHNIVGRLYMAAILPFHRVIVRTMLRRAVANLQQHTI